MVRHFDWIWSDQHFGHAKIIKYTRRPFSDVHHMNHAMRANFLAKVAPSDKVLWLGDCFFFDDTKARNWLSTMPGEHHLVIGNHDSWPRGIDGYSRMMDIGFQSVVDRAYFKMAGRTVLACHYPYVDKPVDRYADLRPKPVPGQVLLHGHTHSALRGVEKVEDSFSIHVGVDAWGFRPIHWCEIEEMIP